MFIEMLGSQSRSHLHDLLTSLGAMVVQNFALPLIPKANSKLTPEGQLSDEGLSSDIEKKIATYLAQLNWYTIAIKNHKELYMPMPIW